ncbi:HK97-gp10 family putative phage morphogenesis protein [Enterococcus sp. AZ102]|uniref:HK97-gp10 family putative phage morphogenesis protein n=1 Tax=Enterococcus sp. AZ102 TaxID=2774865 RepID=UPI003F2744A0
MVRSTVAFDGLKELQKALKENLDMNLVKQVVKNNTDEMTKNAQRIAPVDTGNLKGKIGSETKSGGMIGVMTSKAPYSGYLEFGTRFTDKKPFIKPAFEKQKVKFKSDLMRLAK